MRIGFIGLLTLLFIALKLTGYISWTWLWVLSPLWIGFLLGILIIVGFFAYEMRQIAKVKKRRGY